MSSKLPLLTSNERNNHVSSSCLTIKSTLPDSPFLPAIRRPNDGQKEEEECSQASSAEQAWRRMYSKVEMITAIPKTMVKRHKRQVKEYHSELDALPQLNADLIGKVDFFTKFLDDNNVKTDDFRNEVDKLTRFCEIHGDFEKKERLYYDLMARRVVKLRQIEVVREEIKAYETAVYVLEKMTDNANSKELSESELASEFSKIIEEYAEKSYHLCSLKSREERVNMKFQLLKAKANREIDEDEEIRLVEEHRLQRRYIEFLDTCIYELCTIK